MRIIKAEDLIIPIKELILSAAFDLEGDILAALTKATKTESSELGKNILHKLCENCVIAKNESLPICQDTGTAIFFVEIGEECFIEGSLNRVINLATSQAYQEGFLRKSILDDPLNGKNSGDNTPAIIWQEEVLGDKIKISFTAKGGGAENMSAIKMLKPSDGVLGIKQFVVDTVKKAGGNACPPMIVGVGIGGSFEKCAYLAKKSLLRAVNSHNEDPYYANLEAELLSLVNETGVGVQGLGGDTTALAVLIEKYPRHIASLPVAVNIQCHASRHKSMVF